MAKRRPSIAAKLQPQAPAEPQVQPTQEPSNTGTGKAPSRAGKVNISAYMPPEVKSSLRLVQAKRGGKVSDLMGEALNLLFAKYGVPQAAPTEQDSARA